MDQLERCSVVFLPEKGEEARIPEPLLPLPNIGGKRTDLPLASVRGTMPMGTSRTLI